MNKRFSRGGGQNIVVTVWAGVVGVGLSVAGCECGDDGPGITQIKAQLQVEPQALSFGDVPLGASSMLELVVKNVGQAKLAVCLAELASSACAEASRVQPPGAPIRVIYEGEHDGKIWTVERGEEEFITVFFEPIAEGALSASLVLIHDAGNGPSTIIPITGSGIAPRIEFSSTAIDFGEVTVSQKRTVELVLTNQTQFKQPITIPPLAQSSVAFGTAGLDDAVTPYGSAFTGEVPGMGSLSIRVWFSPPAEGPHGSVLDVRFCPSCRQDVTLSGVGIKPVFEIVPPALDFGTLDEGVAATRQFVVRNIGNVNLTVMRPFELESGSSNEFAITPIETAPAIVPPGQALTVDVTYVGVTPGRDMGRVVVNTNAWDDPGTPVSERVGYVALQAISQGPDINPIPPSVNFGTVPINGSPSMRNVILENTGNVDLVVSSITMTTNTPEISIATLPVLPATLPPQASIRLALQYAPTDQGQDAATIRVQSNDRDEGDLPIEVYGIGGTPTACSIAVAPTQLAFGLVERGRIATLPVEVRNAGAQPCSVSNLRLTGAVEFTIASGAVPVVSVAPSSNHRVDISYAPTTYGNHSTLLEFDSDDPAQSRVQVPVTGTSQPSDLRVIPSQLDFNVVPVTCRSPNRAITIYNTGSTLVTVTQVFLDPSTSPEFELEPFATPTPVPAGASSVIHLRYHPANLGPDTGVLFIMHSAASVPFAVPLTGEGQLSPTVTDTFQQVPTPQADLLFIVDNSGSMIEEQNVLAANLGAFLSYAQTQGIDYRIAVTTTDVDPGGEQGRFVGTTRIITPSTPNGQAAFAALVMLGTGGSGDEKGLEAAYLALTDPLINTWNAGFLRTDASLAIVVVSDEEDYSLRPVAFYENFFRNIKGFQNPGLFSLSAVVGTQTPRCTSANGDADYGARYIQVAQGTGGVVESICNANWGATLANIALNSFGLKRQFQLSSQPVPLTLLVQINGTTVPSTSPSGMSNWTYDQATNSVAFSTGAVPQAGVTVTVTYTVACLP